MKDFDELTERVAEFPIKDNRFSAIGIYVNNLEEFINTTCDQAEIRLKSRSHNVEDPVIQAEIESEINHMQEFGKSEFSMTICGSVLVSIYFAYEASIKNIFFFLEKNKSLISLDKYKKRHSLRIKDDNDGKINFLLVAKEYSKEILKINLFGTNSSYVAIDELRRLRISYVHNGCLLSNLSDRTQKKIIKGEYRFALGSADENWYITPTGVSLFFNETHESFKHFQRQALNVAIT